MAGHKHGPYRRGDPLTRQSAPKGAQPNPDEEVDHNDSTEAAELAGQIASLQARIEVLEAPPESPQLRRMRRLARSSPVAMHALNRERSLGGAKW
jgi:hypothetical protein